MAAPRTLSPLIADPEAFQDFVDSLIDLAPAIEHNVAELKKDPGNRAVVADLFRSIHNVKGDAALCKFELAVRIAHPIESVLSRLRDGSLHFSHLLGEVVLLAIDRLELAVDALASSRAYDHLKLDVLIQGLEQFEAASNEQVDEAAVRIIEAVTGFRPVSTPSTAPTPNVSHIPEQRDQVAADLTFFRQLALQLENHSQLFAGRSARLLRLAEETNNVAGRPVDPVQLEAAVYMHDIGMMFLPESVWLKVGKLSDEDKAALHHHPVLGAELLKRMPGWSEAARMVEQHHEMPDGTGYPKQLRNDDICDGAKILAIADAFEAVTLKHSHRGHGRSLLRAIAEINACQNQFAPPWIDFFNRVIRKQIEAS